jgi:membrane-bound inhibitor of C-type lysozyme
MKVPFAGLIVLLGVAVPAFASAQTNAASPAPKRQTVAYDCSDKKTRVTYDNAKSRAYLTYAAKRILLIRQPAPNAEHFYSAKYNLDWTTAGDTATLASRDAKTGAETKLAECTLLKK